MRALDEWSSTTRPAKARTVTSPLPLLDRRSTSLIELDQAASRLVDPDSVTCPRCGPGAAQLPIYVGPDGALDRVDFVCSSCGAEHPIWVG